jgi:hypothetical protein
MTGVIASSILPGWYLVRDQAGRQHRAASQELWRKGEKVTVIDGVIVGRAGTLQTTATYEV